MTSVNRCLLCGSERLSTFLTRRDVPIHQNRLYRSQPDAVAAPRGDLEMTVCIGCGFVFNRAFDPELVLYGEAYDNTQTCSGSFAAYVGKLVDHLVTVAAVRNADVIEVGCGKGLFLRALIEHPFANNRGIGFDPSYEGPLEGADGRLRFERRFYGPDCVDVPADVVVCRHVIEHVQQPRSFLDSIRLALAQRPAAKVFFETPCVEWILREKVIWDFFYEHCSLFSKDSLQGVFERTGFQVASTHHTFGGQYLWLEARLGDRPGGAVEAAGDVPRLAAAYSEAETWLVAEWSARLKDQLRRGKVALWGAGAKGVTFANLVDPDRRLIECVIDLNPNKQGGFIPGSGHPIVAPTSLVERGVRSAFLMNPNYRDENMTLLHRLGVSIDLIS